MKVFITGGAGFIGSSLACRLLNDEKAQITIFDNFSSGGMELLQDFVDNKRCQIISADLLDKDTLQRAIRGHDVVYHLAANPDIKLGATDTEIDLKLSTVSTYNVLECMRKAGIGVIVYASGSGVYGDTTGEVTAEDFGPLLPVSLYGAGKLGAEALISGFAHLFGMRAYVFRPANIVGGRQTHGVALDFIRKLQKTNNRLEILGDGRQTKSYLYIDDFLDAVKVALEKAHGPINVFNVATDDAVSVDWIAGAVINALGLSGVELVHSGGACGWPGDVPVVRMDIAKIKALGWSPGLNSKDAVKRSIQEMLSRTGN